MPVQAGEGGMGDMARSCWEKKCSRRQGEMTGRGVELLCPMGFPGEEKGSQY